MPITRKQFELRIDPPLLRGMQQIHQFLSANRDKAYAELELMQEAQKGSPDLETMLRLVPLGVPGQTSVGRRIWSPALEKLIELGAVEARVVDSTTYFAYRADLDL